LVSKYLLTMNNKEKILDVALHLFAEFGFHAVSTAKIAKQAKVSEALVFKHYRSKLGLLETIYAQVSERLQVLYTPMMTEEEPIEVIKSFISVVYEIKPEDYPFWKLIFKIKWNDNFYKPEETEPLIEKLSWALKKLKVPNHRLEAELLSHTMENIGISILRDGIEKNKKLLKLLMKKYK